MDIQSIYRVYQQSTGVCIDTRHLQRGEIYFALKGERFDGNAFVSAAIDAGALAAVADDPSLAESAQVLAVDDALQTLQQLAHHHRQQMPARVIGITGSNGKTTSKELISAVLASTFKVLHTEGNLNNHIGVPLTLLRLSPAYEFAVVEMGANHQGEIATLCSMAQPEYGVVTNVGKAHLEGFGGIQGVVKAKKELYDYLAATGGTVFINPALPYLADMAAGITHRITYGEGADVNGGLIDDTSGLKLTVSWKGGDMSLNAPLTGRYNVNNILLAVAVGLHFGVLPNAIQKAIEGYAPSNNRSRVISRGSTTVILDAYNANPSSMEEALDNLASYRGSDRVAILGDMLELGRYSDTEHARIAGLAAASADQVVLVGEAFGKVGPSAMHFPDAASCKIWFEAQDFRDAVVLIKGSRKLELEKILATRLPASPWP